MVAPTPFWLWKGRTMSLILIYWKGVGTNTFSFSKHPRHRYCNMCGEGEWAWSSDTMQNQHSWLLEKWGFQVSSPSEQNPSPWGGAGAQAWKSHDVIFSSLSKLSHNLPVVMPPTSVSHAAFVHQLKFLILSLPLPGFDIFPLLGTQALPQQPSDLSCCAPSVLSLREQWAHRDMGSSHRLEEAALS